MTKETVRDVIEYARQTLEAFEPEALKSMGLDVLAEKLTAVTDSTYTFAHLEAAACMWEHVLHALRKHRESRNYWEEYRVAYGMCELRERVIRHAPILEVAYQEAEKNGYDKAFDLDYVPKYMEDHVAKILT